MTPRNALHPGRELGPGYEVIEHLARSNVLDVYDAWSHERGCRVAVKTPTPARLNDRKTVNALLREGRILGVLTHPHIVRAYEVLREPRPAVVLETLSGETVAHLVHRRRRRLSAAELGMLGVHLASAVGYLHGQGLLHLDLKPSNIVAERGKAKVIDMGVARSPGRAPAEVGTWCYMAPEQARGGKLTPAADVWGAGGVLYEAATGECAFDDDYDYPQLHRRADRVSLLRPRLPAQLRRIIDACLEPDPEARPSVRELAAACEEAAGLPASERRLGRG
ncbi:MAG TPA: serine/threonine-protein kinase [Thermoleophilaceae bacterium]|nr:serine/threonine-protein kinase [Thermoleophilaceae bacterium]